MILVGHLCYECRLTVPRQSAVLRMVPTQDLCLFDLFPNVRIDRPPGFKWQDGEKKAKVDDFYTMPSEQPPSMFMRQLDSCLWTLASPLHLRHLLQTRETVHADKHQAYPDVQCQAIKGDWDRDTAPRKFQAGQLLQLPGIAHACLTKLRRSMPTILPCGKRSDTGA